MKTMRLFFIWMALHMLSPMLRAQNATSKEQNSTKTSFKVITPMKTEKIKFDLNLNSKDSTLTCVVVNNEDSTLLVSCFRWLYEWGFKDPAGSVYIIKYRQGKYEYEQILPLNEKSFKLDAGESFTYKLDISDYMKEQLITIEGILLGGLKPYSDSRHILMRRKIDAAKDTAACNVSAHPQ